MWSQQRWGREGDRIRGEKRVGGGGAGGRAGNPLIDLI